jgi:hypothetical protein
LTWQEAILNTFLATNGREFKACVNEGAFVKRFKAMLSECRQAWADADVGAWLQEDLGTSSRGDAASWASVDVSSWTDAQIDSLLSFVEAAANQLLDRIQPLLLNGTFERALTPTALTDG